MIKVLYLLNHAGKAGTERYVHSLMKKLHNEKIEAHFVYNEDGLLVEWVKELGITPCKIVMDSPFDLIAANNIREYCEKNDIQIIHTQFLRENFVAMLAKFAYKKVKVFYTNHFIMEKRKPLKIAYKMFDKLQNQVIAVCNKGRDMMVENGINSKKIEVIFNGVDVNYWGEVIESTIRGEYGISEDEFVFLCGSRFAHDKGHKFLIGSIKKLKSITKHRFKLILANDGPLLDECRAYCRELELEDAIIFTGYRKDIKNIIYGADVYVNSSEHEALSFAIIEVLACGIPVIATDMAGNGDILNEQNNCGMLVEYKNEDMMAETMKKLLENPALRKILKTNAIKTANEVFNLDKMIEKTYNLYQRAIED